MTGRRWSTSFVSPYMKQGRLYPSGSLRGGEMSNAAASPYAARASNAEDISANPEADAIRREHISREASIRSVGILYYLGGGGLTLAAAFALFAPRSDMSMFM